MQEGRKPPVDKTGETVDALQDKLKGAFCPSSSSPAPAAAKPSSAGAPAADPPSTPGDQSSWVKAWHLVNAVKDRVTTPPPAEEVEREPEAPAPEKIETAPAWHDRLFGSTGPVNEFAAAPKLPKSVYVSSLFINMLGLALPLVILQVYDRILPNEATATLSLLILGLVVIMIIDTTMKIARAYMVGWVTAHHEFAVATEAISRLLNTPSSRIESEPPSAHIDRLNAIDAMRDFYGGQSRLLLLDLPFIVVFLGLMAFIGGYLVFVPIVLFCTLGVLSVSRGMALRKVLQTRAQHDERRYDFIIESLAGIQTIKTMAMEPQIQRRFERLQKIGATASHDTILLGNSAQIVGNLFSNLAMISVVTVGAYFVVHGSLTMGALAACTLLSGRTIQPVLKGLGLWTQVQSVSVARARITKLFELAPPPAEEVSKLDHIDGEITLSSVSFAYAPDAPLVLKDVDLVIKPGEMIGLCGGDGSGKSSIAKLIRGEYPPTSGAVMVDGYEPSGEWRSALEEWISYVPQNASIFQGTILENIAMFRSGDAIDAAREAAQLIGLEADIHRLPSGYDMRLNEGITEELPVGIIQRVIIARALARKSRILLFDEGNSALDGASDRLLREGLQKLKGQKTIILVSQRPSLLRIADRVLELADGRLSDFASGEGDRQAQAARQSEAS